MSLNSLDTVVSILKESRVCLHHEITDRAWNSYKVNFRSIMRSIDRLFSEKIINRKIVPSPYSKPFHFYFLSGTDADEVNRTISYKLELLWKHSKLTDEIGRFGEVLVGKIVESLGYSEVEIRKERHGDIGIGRMDIDVWGKHPEGYYQNIEVKNRRQPVNVSDVEEIKIKTLTAHARWNLPVKSALVCSFIYKRALTKANSANIPVVITEKVFVPEKYANFYEEYRKALGSYYIEAANCENPPEYLSELIENYILIHKYDE